MKRILLIIGALLMGLAMRAQSVDNTCRYWFDRNHTQAVTATFGDSTWQAQLDVGSLSEGIHTLHLHILAADTVSVFNIAGDSLYHAMDTVIMKWSAPQSYFFLKINDTPAEELVYHYWFDQDFANVQSGIVGDGYLLLDVDDLENGLHAFHVMLKGGEYSASQTYYFLKTDTWQNGSANYVYHCWFDEDFAHQQTDTLGTGHLFLDVADLEEGMHTVHVLLEGSSLTATQSYMFMKAETFSVDTLDMSHLVYHCWFDQDFEHRVTDSLGEGSFLLDVNNLGDGLHSLHVMLECSALTATQSYMFMKMPVENPSTELQYHCWFDQDYDNVQTGLLGSGIFELEVDGLSNGIHTVNVQLNNGTLTAPQSYLFYKIPLGGNGIARWEYWLNGDYSNRTDANVSPVVDTLDIISLLPVGHPSIRSSCFHFHPNGDSPYINAKNEISFRFWDAESRFMDMSRLYVDEQVQQEIVAQVFERNTTETFTAPRDNQIQWFKLDAVVGDSLAFKASKACTMQLFAPSGEEVLNVSGSESITLRGLHAWEDGTYYLAVHDMTSSGETVSVTYNWIYRYAILAYDVHVVGNGGCSTITFQGNGFNSLLDVYLVNAQNDTIRSLVIGHESKTTVSVMFNFFEASLGMYDADFVFYDETIRVNGAVEVEEAQAILLSSSASYPSSFLRGTTTPVTYSFSVTNYGNMTAYAVPIYAYIATPYQFDDITHIEFDGLRLPSILDYFNVNWDSVNVIENIIDLRQRAKEIGDDHNFYRESVPNEDGGYKRVRSNFFFVDLAPNETKTLNLKLTPNPTFSSGSMEAWMTVPNQNIPPYLPNEGGGSGGSGSGPGGSGGSSNPYCCVYEQIQCTVDVVCDGIDLLNLDTDISDCICGILSNGNELISRIVCEGENPNDAWKNLNQKSLIGTAVGCIQVFNPFQKLGMALDIVSGFLDQWDLIELIDNPSSYGTQIENCISMWQNKKPDCPSGDPQGGSSSPVVPRDPNDIYGYLSESGSHYMRQEIQNVQYEIEFENDTTLATAAAHTIIVRDTLDATKFDLNSLAARSVTIGDKRLDLNGEQTFARTLDLRPEIYVIAQVEQDYDPNTGIIQWTIQSLDPMTMEPTDDPNQGVLPVNYFGDGVGFIDYSIDIKEAFADGTEISNRADIIFDQEDIIMTPTWTNIVDAVKPTSYIEEVTPVADSLNFQFVSSDNRSGVWYHTLYYRNDSTEMEWQVRKPQILENSYLLPIDSLLTTEFLVMAVDSAGNREEKEMVAEYTYFSTVPATITQTTALNEGWNWYSTYIEQEGVDGLTMLKNSLGTNGIRIQSKNDGALDQFEYNGTSNWYGSLNVLNNEQMYKVLTNAACNVAMSGYLTRMENHPITLNEGWNWIGFPNGQSLSLETAMSGFTPETNDVIKGRTASATFVSFDNYSLWYGTLNMLEPGQGYMYKSNSSSPKTLVFQNGRSWKAAVPNTHEGTAFTSNTAAFADNMLVTAVIELGGHELRSEDYELAAFVDNECRGSVKLMYVEPFDIYVAFLLAFGEATETMHFVLTNGTDVVWSDDNLSYVTDGTIGTLTEPITLHFGTMGLNDSGAEYVNVFPNPSRGVFNIEGKGIRRIEVIDGYGQVLRSEEVKNDCLQIDLGNRAVGAYLLRVVTDRGVTSKKLVLVR